MDNIRFLDSLVPWALHVPIDAVPYVKDGAGRVILIAAPHPDIPPAERLAIARLAAAAPTLLAAAREAAALLPDQGNAGPLRLRAFTALTLLEAAIDRAVLP